MSEEKSKEELMEDINYYFKTKQNFYQTYREVLDLVNKGHYSEAQALNNMCNQILFKLLKKGIFVEDKTK